MSSQISDKLSYDLNSGLTGLGDLESVTPLLSGDQDASYKWKGVTLVLREKVNIRAKFSAEDISDLIIQVKVGDNTPVEADITPADSNIYYVYFDGISATQYDEQVTFTFIKDGVEVGAELNYSVNTYLKAASALENANLLSLLNAINEYGQAAKNVA